MAWTDLESVIFIYNNAHYRKACLIGLTLVNTCRCNYLLLPFSWPLGIMYSAALYAIILQMQILQSLAPRLSFVAKLLDVVLIWHNASLKWHHQSLFLTGKMPMMQYFMRKVWHKWSPMEEAMVKGVFWEDNLWLVEVLCSMNISTISVENEESIIFIDGHSLVCYRDRTKEKRSHVVTPIASGDDITAEHYHCRITCSNSSW